MIPRRQYAHDKPRVPLPCRYVPAKPSRSKYDPATEDRKHAEQLLWLLDDAMGYNK